MRTLQSVCVYCGSSAGYDPLYREAAVAMGRHLAANNLALIYGGGNIGLMGALADAVLAAGGQVTGIIPHHLIKMEVGHRRLTTLVEVDSMHTRKLQMAELADAFVAMPGGIGTAEEVLEVLTWLQLGLHAKPVGLLNTNGYYAHLLAFLSHMTSTGFLKEEHRTMLVVEDDPAALMKRLSEFVPEKVDKRIPPIASR